MPAAAAPIGVPLPPAMSMPSCMRPQRGPKPEVSVPLTGHTIPDADGAPTATEPLGAAGRPWASRILLPSSADRSASPFASASMSSRSPATRDEQRPPARQQLGLPRPLGLELGLGRDRLLGGHLGAGLGGGDVGAHPRDRVAGGAGLRRRSVDTERASAPSRLAIDCTRSLASTAAARLPDSTSTSTGSGSPRT